MKALTKKQKLEGYTYALLIVYKAMQGDCTPYICNNLRNWFNNRTRGYIYCSWEVHKLFPEILKQLPDESRRYSRWWPSTDYYSRIKAIERAIQLTENLKK